MAFIGGNLHDIETSAARLADSGSLAVTSAAQTSSAAVTLAGVVDDAVTQLVSQFERIADTLSADITQSHAVLASSDWHGQSRENALAMKEELLGQVHTVLASATTTLAAEKAAFISRSEALVDAVQTDFQRVMHDVDARYASLAAASRRTRDNLAIADQSITIG